MRKTLPTIIPAPAMLLLDFIVGIEAPRGYDTIYGNNQDKLPKPLTTMTLGEVIDAQKSWTKRFKSSAAGGPQFMRQTLIDICTEIPSLRGDMLFDKVLQQKLGYHLLLRRGYEKFIAGELSIVAFGKALAQEWASFPVLAACKGQERLVERGQSYYAGDGLNKSLVAPERVEAMLRKVLAAARQQPIPDEDPPAFPSAPAPAAKRPLWAILADLLAKIFGGRK
ncbi:hypothetical protein PWG15_05490 [Ensifer adhaerens]|uniref:hypothetical protein n=1 Tax=Ensifer adhaerens TaxID=106592 RepID=UPI0023A91C55|nr:hypothetical protein [Ensifer adhaerens]WDZ77958.1 hypothetical protein PWG15_05490 [Ensifer adhaerens]